MSEVIGSSVLKAIRESDSKYKVLEGSTRSTKTISIVQDLVLKAIESPGIIIRSFRFDQVTCKRTVGKDLLDVLQMYFPEIYNLGKWNKQEGIFYYHNGSEHHLSGCEPLKLHGQKQDIAHLNEVPEIPYESWGQIEPRTTKEFVFDFNPSVTRHWIFSTVLTRPGVFYNHSTYKDNKFITDVQIAGIESKEPTKENCAAGTAWKWWWEVYGLGLRGRRPGAIYTRWEIVEFWPERHACQRWGYGLDFGFSIDPTALIECALFQNKLFLRERIYETGLCAVRSESNPNFPNIETLFEELEVGKSDNVYGDSAQPDSIAELCSVGYNVSAAKKGPGSIESGINRVQRFQLCIHITSDNLRAECENYAWKRDRSTDKQLNVPIDEFNHGLDAVRYFAEVELDPQRFEREKEYRFGKLPVNEIKQKRYDPLAV